MRLSCISRLEEIISLRKISEKTEKFEASLNNPTRIMCAREIFFQALKV